MADIELPVKHEVVEISVATVAAEDMRLARESLGRELLGKD